ncbi:hypothetical protein Micbo1qcDRAFT_170471 [Microdochium bolleyi]|uniref:Uncharacterized protein n=1 Tax=Microdochium bolleyi TaxID=196109 RepID=A0A136JHR4_9PEZI|nr:hypothetical protein Micbo1qcDRAFT_170471 [Microdochium bolleyi]
MSTAVQAGAVACLVMAPSQSSDHRAWASQAATCKIVVAEFTALHDSRKLHDSIMQGPQPGDGVDSNHWLGHRCDGDEGSSSNDDWESPGVLRPESALIQAQPKNRAVGTEYQNAKALLGVIMMYLWVPLALSRAWHGLLAHGALNAVIRRVFLFDRWLSGPLASLASWRFWMLGLPVQQLIHGYHNAWLHSNGGDRRRIATSACRVGQFWQSRPLPPRTVRAIKHMLVNGRSLSAEILYVIVPMIGGIQIAATVDRRRGEARP